MADINLIRELAGDELVFHFGGRLAEVDAYTFANSLLSFSEAIREINSQLNPGSALRITIEGIGEGSFRAKLRTTTRFVSALLQSRATTETARLFVIPLFVAFVYDRFLSDSSTKITINDDSYIVAHGRDRIILPRSVYERKKSLPNPAVIEKNVAMGFHVLDEDTSITDFGITKNLDDRRPLISIPHEDFPILSQYAAIETTDGSLNEQTVEQREKLIVLRAILQRSSRRWQFVWNGIKISAPITDEAFYDALARHEYEFGQGDTLDVMLKIYQQRDESTGVFLNVAYEVTKVFRRLPGPRQGSLSFC